MGLSVFLGRMVNDMKKRVKCANCGMIYNILIENYESEHQITGECPKCKSNAFNVIPEVWRQNL